MGGIYDANTRVLTPSTIIETGSGIEFVNLRAGEMDIEPNEDGTFTLPDDVDLKDCTLIVADYAGNETSLKLDHVKESRQGTIELTFDLDGQEFSR